jgi:hypothetical protein
MPLQNSLNLIRRRVHLIVDKKDKPLNNTSTNVEVGQNKQYKQKDPHFLNTLNLTLEQQ